VTSRYGTAVAQAWNRVHPRLTHRAAWLDHDGPLPVIDGTLIRLQVDHLPGDRDPKPMWLWWSHARALPDDVDRLWQAFLRRFDLEHTFRLFKQVLGWTVPHQKRPNAQGTTRTRRLNGKLSPHGSEPAMMPRAIADERAAVDPRCGRSGYWHQHHGYQPFCRPGLPAT
jgi:hypothetical protein